MATNQDCHEISAEEQEFYSLLQHQHWVAAKSQLELIITGLRRKASDNEISAAMSPSNSSFSTKSRSDSDLDKKPRSGRSLSKEAVSQPASQQPPQSIGNRPMSLGSMLGLGGGVGGGPRPREAQQVDYTAPVQDMKQALLGAINELNDELDNINQPICEVAQEYIHADECIMTFGYSLTLELFLKSAARKRKFQVIVCESGPSLEGHRLASALCKHPNITIALVPDSSVYALMSRVNKVIFNPHVIMADGGAICSSGHMMVAVAAKTFAVPVVGVTGAFKLSPLFSHNQSNVLSHLLSPADVIPYDCPINFENVAVIVPAFDYLPPDMVNLYVTNNGSHQPSYMYRLLGEIYHPDDYDLEDLAVS